MFAYSITRDEDDNEKKRRRWKITKSLWSGKEMLRKIGLTHHACIITTKNKWMTLSASVRIKIQVGENVHHILWSSHFDFNCISAHNVCN